MKQYLKTALVLASICAVSAILLAAVNYVTAPEIAEYEESVKFDALNDVCCGMSLGDEIILYNNQYITSYFELYAGNKTEGYILCLSTAGYGGPMTLIASYDTEGRILKVNMVSNSETPGLGKRSEKQGYMDMFLNKNIIPTTKDALSEDELMNVSGATLTFSGISKALSYGSDFIKSI